MKPNRKAPLTPPCSTLIRPWAQREGLRWKHVILRDLPVHSHPDNKALFEGSCLKSWQQNNNSVRRSKNWGSVVPKLPFWNISLVPRLNRVNIDKIHKYSSTVRHMTIVDIMEILFCANPYSSLHYSTFITLNPWSLYSYYSISCVFDWALWSPAVWCWFEWQTCAAWAAVAC